MEKKICPTCGTVNSSSEMMCMRCMADISAVIPQREEVPKDKKLLIKHTIEKLEIKNGDIIGRDNKWGSYLDKFQTVSRKHAQFTFLDEIWYIEDCGSTNGTYINNEDIRGKGKVSIKNGDKIGLSKSFTVEVEEE